MDSETILSHFDEIEQKVERLIDVCKSLESTKAELLDKIEKLEKDLQEKIETERRYATEKDLIRSKIDGLLVRLQEVSEP